MDHKVSKDMISSGMIPSGEKTQADLGRTQYGSAPSPNALLDAYKSMYEHHKKDADGNTIPHEGEELNEGKIPAGLQAYLDKKKGKKEDKKEVKEMIERVAGMPPAKPKPPVKKEPLKAETNVDKMKGQITARKTELSNLKDDKRERLKKVMKDFGEGADLFDIVSTYFIEEGYDKNDVYTAMSSVDLSEEVQDIHEFVGAAMAGLKAVGGLMAKKGIGGALKTVGAKVGSKIGGSAGRKLGYKAGSAIANNPMTSYYMAKDLMPGGGGGGNPQPMMSKRTSTVSASADLFDIVKGQLIDEGLSEEEIKDIMLTLTPDEIMSEMAVNPNIAAMDAKNKADMIARAQANKVPDKVREASKRQMKAGTPREDKNNPYTTQDKKTIIDYNKNK